jgi:hypothetical protein
MAKPLQSDEVPRRRGRFERFVRRLWWLHSLWALAFGVGVMIYARRGLAHADKMLLFVAVSWFLVFLALRFVVGPENSSPEDRLTKKGLRLATNYIIKNLYQQMFFFLVPLYAASTTFSLAAGNFWLAPLLLACAVLSTMDLVMDNFIMQHRAIASLLYGVCLFGVLNLMLPVAFGIGHFAGLLIAAGATAPAVALLTFRVRQVVTTRGGLLTGAAAVVLLCGAWWGRALIPPAPLSMHGAVSHGTRGSREILPSHHERIRRDELDGLRCVTLLSQPGGLHDEFVHIWQKDGLDRVRTQPLAATLDRQKGVVFWSAPDLGASPVGSWRCVVKTEAGQLVGQLDFEIVP